MQAGGEGAVCSTLGHAAESSGAPAPAQILLAPVSERTFTGTLPQGEPASAGAAALDGKEGGAKGSVQASPADALLEKQVSILR